MQYSKFGKGKIGLSLSMCISEMVRENIDYSKVEKIISGTSAHDKQEFLDILEHYGKTCWKGFEQKATILAWRFWQDGKIEQPRLTTGAYYSIADGKWTDDASKLKI